MIDKVVPSVPVILSFLWMTQCNLFVAHAFRPPSLSEELGCSPTLTILINGIENYRKNRLVYFDPLGIASDTNFPRLREAELKHGRIAMLAMTERILVPLALGPLAWNIDQTSNDRSFYYGDILSRIQALSLSEISKVMVTCGVLEIFVFTQKDPKDMPGDYGTGYFGRRDKGLNEWKLRIELENGRLAMLAFLTQFVLEIAAGGLTWDQQWGLFTETVEANSYLTNL